MRFMTGLAFLLSRHLEGAAPMTARQGYRLSEPHLSNSLLKDILNSGRLRYNGHCSRHQLTIYLGTLNKGHPLSKGQR